MKKKNLIYIVIVLVVISAISYGIITKSSSKKTYDGFTQCITEQGAIMYGTDWCHFCQDQKKKFGKSFKYVNYINCDLNELECNTAGVEGYPTWVINGESYSGVQQLQYLSSLTKCELIADEN